jgi:hypothetical protein
MSQIGDEFVMSREIGTEKRDDQTFNRTLESGRRAPADNKGRSYSKCRNA